MNVEMEPIPQYPSCVDTSGLTEAEYRDIFDTLVRFSYDTGPLEESVLTPFMFADIVERLRDFYVIGGYHDIIPGSSSQKSKETILATALNIPIYIPETLKAPKHYDRIQIVTPQGIGFTAIQFFEHFFQQLETAKERKESLKATAEMYIYPHDESITLFLTQGISKNVEESQRTFEEALTTHLRIAAASLANLCVEADIAVPLAFTQGLSDIDISGI